MKKILLITTVLFTSGCNLSTEQTPEQVANFERHQQWLKSIREDRRQKNRVVQAQSVAAPVLSTSGPSAPSPSEPAEAPSEPAQPSFCNGQCTATWVDDDGTVKEWELQGSYSTSDGTPHEGCSQFNGCVFLPVAQDNEGNMVGYWSFPTS